MKLLFLDNDHVLNCGDRDRHPNRYLPLHWRHVKELNRILAAEPDLMVVISSAWRYHVHSGNMTLEGLESLYMHFGADMHRRLHGVTDKDPYHWGDPAVEGWTTEQWHTEGIKWRSCQIAEYASRFRFPRCAVLDDLPLVLGPALFQTTRERGLTPKIADAVIQWFGKGGSDSLTSGTEATKDDTLPCSAPEAV